MFLINPVVRLLSTATMRLWGLGAVANDDFSCSSKASSKSLSGLETLSPLSPPLTSSNSSSKEQGVGSANVRQVFLSLSRGGGLGQE
jgi:hypothetical protein